MDMIRFPLIKTNKKSNLLPLNEIASGGEIIKIKFSYSIRNKI